MQNYNNYGNYRNPNRYQNGAPRNNTANAMNNGNVNNGWNNGVNYNNANYSMGNYQVSNPTVNDFQMNGYNQPQVQQQQADDRIFVAGRLGADAYQLPHGVDVQILWDDDVDRFYIKGYDERGRQRVIGDFDFTPHVEDDSQQVAPDMSKYATKDDIRNMISDAIKKSKNNNSNYVTMDFLNKTLSELCVGNGGKVVRMNESDA